ncbi:SRPBCC family protein [Flavobacterium frigoris]|uniref:Activator of Hsp90 ATPase 1 family protein n=1 Tax=Flavobacterium frigoris (strain PS1) TaxID=1086011 RepID=H7FLP5_FLAFP|nr:SRPBCC family protein [Flavobacterium frigoris]EIA10587.1 activator of Hsp90 ATPase 1 family protein [Flavobacterium frigoris PS1]
MNIDNTSYAEAAMLIRKPISEVFESFINPEITTKFWFTKSSGKLEEGKYIDWTWEMYSNHTVTVKVLAIKANEAIVIQWGEDEKALAEWEFNDLGDSKTFVTITYNGIQGSTEEMCAQIRDTTEGFSLVLAGLKAYLEHNIQLNLVADRFPVELTEE